MRSVYAAKKPENISHKTTHEEIPRAKKHVVFHFYKPLTPCGGELRHGQPLSPAILYKGQKCLVFAIAGEISHKVLPRKCAAHKVAIERAQNIGKRPVRRRTHFVQNICYNGYARKPFELPGNSPQILGYTKSNGKIRQKQKVASSIASDALTRFSTKPFRCHADAIKGLNSLRFLRHLLFHRQQPSLSDAAIEKRKNTDEQIAAL